MPQSRKQQQNRAPGHLSPEAKGWWKRLVNEYGLEDEGRMLLRVALESFDRLNQARRLIDKDGLVVRGPKGMQAHPALATEKEARLALMRAWRQLGFELSEPIGK